MKTTAPKTPKVSYTSLAIRKTGHTAYELLRHSHAEDGSLISREVVAPELGYFSVVQKMKRTAADTWKPDGEAQAINIVVQ